MTILNKQQPNFGMLISHPAHFFAFGFGSGLVPKAPGTWGTLVGLPLFYMVSHIAFIQQLTLVFILFLLGVYACHMAGNALGISDHGAIVCDEIVAMMLVLIFTPSHGWAWLAAFLLFRLFDIWKPFPIRYFDKTLKNGFGVMFDDLLAAIYAILCLQGLLWINSQI